MKLLLGAVAAIATLTLAVPAEATSVIFNITGDYTASFTLDQMPTPKPDYVYDGYGFSIADVAGFSAKTGRADLTFFNADGLLVSFRDDMGDSDPDNDVVDYLLDIGGAKLYDGTEAAPSFKPGTYALTGLSTPGNFTVSIAAVPEPATWAMMIAGMAMTGASLRYRRRTLAVRCAA